MVGKINGERYRKILKQRFLKNGFDGLVEKEILELFLSYAIPRQDIRGVSELLFDNYGNFKEILDAPIKELVAFPCLDVNSSILLKAARDFPDFYIKRVAQIENKEELLLGSLEPEHFFLLKQKTSNGV